MQKLIIQIPCFNEETSLPITAQDLPRKLPGIDAIEWLIIDDGSSDRTSEVAKSLGFDHILTLTHHVGLAGAFSQGIKACLELGADIIVNTDADNQYCSGDIEKLIGPLLCNQADIAVGARPIDQIKHFSLSKKLLQKLGSFVMRRISRLRIDDAPSGFRAITRDAAIKLRIFSTYSYTMEMLIQAQAKGLRLISVPIRTNPDLRPSRLVKSTSSYIIHSMATILRIFLYYQPLKFFMFWGISISSIGAILALRWVIYYMGIKPATHIPSLIMAAIFLLSGLLFITVGLLADLISVNRRLLEDIQYQQRVKELASHENTLKNSITAMKRSA